MVHLRTVKEHWVMEVRARNGRYDWAPVRSDDLQDEDNRIRWILNRLEAYGPPTKAGDHLMEWHTGLVLDTRIRLVREEKVEEV